MSLPSRKMVFSYVFSVLLGVATIWGITSANSGIQSKFEPWLWDKIQELEANGTSRMMSLIIILVDNSTSLKNYAAELLINSHGAEDLWIGSMSPSITVTVNSTEVKTIATYNFVELLGDGERKFTFMQPERLEFLTTVTWGGISGQSNNTVTLTVRNTGSVDLYLSVCKVNGATKTFNGTSAAVKITTGATAALYIQRVRWRAGYSCEIRFIGTSGTEFAKTYTAS
jgi:hypothetical protein